MRVGRAAINVKSIPDLQVFDITEISVETGELVLLARGAVGAAFGEQSCRSGPVENLLAQKRRAAAIKTVGRGVFVDEALELQRVVAVAGRFQRRREMADGDGAEPALGSSRLTRIVDDEGIDDREPAEQRGRQAGRRQRHRLAWQPFERAMGAEMDHGVDALDFAQPEIEGGVSVARRQVGIVIARFAVERVAAVWLNGGDQSAVARKAHGEVPIADGGIGVRRAPGGDNLGAGLRIEFREQALVVGEREEWRRLSIAKRGDETCVVGKRIADIEAFAFEKLQDLGGAGDGVEADGMGGLPGCARIVGQHQRELALRARRGGETRPERCASRRGGDALCRGLMGDASKFQPGDLALLGLEGDRGGEEPPIELGQHHLHGEVGLRKPARRVLPGFAARSGEHDLQDRGAGRFQGRRRIVKAGGERRGVEHDSGRPVAQRCGDEVARVAILEAGDVKRSNVESFVVERPRQGLDGREVGGEQIGAVEHDRRKRAPRHLRHVETMHAMHGHRLCA